MSIKSHMSQFTEAILQEPDPAKEKLDKPTISTELANKRASASMSSPGALAHFSQNMHQMEDELAKLKATQGLPALLKIKDLIASPFQTRDIDTNKVSELVANLSGSPLSTPISVRKIDEDRYEIIAGHHRVEAFKDLGRTEIPASVVNMTDVEAEKMVFYDNFLSPNLSDFEKYKGFARIKLSRKLSLEQLAAESGVSKSLVSLLMSFEKLDPIIIDAIKKYPNTVSATLANKLVNFDSSYFDRIINAIEMIFDGNLTQMRAIGWIEQKEKSPKKQSTTINSGRFKFAEVFKNQKQLTIKFANEEDANEAQEAIFELIKSRAMIARSEAKSETRS